MKGRPKGQGTDGSATPVSTNGQYSLAAPRKRESPPPLDRPSSPRSPPPSAVSSLLILVRFVTSTPEGSYDAKELLAMNGARSRDENLPFEP
jgi:hypothetical protein